LNKLHSVEEFNRLLEQGKPIFVLKHSLTCPISQAAYQEYQNFAETNHDIPAYYLTVQEARPLSNYIAETYDIRHESPQALLLSQNKVVWNASHWEVTQGTLAEVWKESK
jgi:bacillithiol system protein YtxJ